MKDKVKVILRDGSLVDLPTWQKIYGLLIGSNRISKHFGLHEGRFLKDIDLYGEVIINSLLFMVLDEFVHDANRSVTLNALNRNKQHQSQLTKQGFRTATLSPHLVTRESDKKITGGTAVDIDTTSHAQTNMEVEILKLSAERLGIKIRIGYKEYQIPSTTVPNGFTFIHVDVAPEFYASGKPWNKYPHPKAWEREARW